MLKDIIPKSIRDTFANNHIYLIILIILLFISCYLIFFVFPPSSSPETFRIFISTIITCQIAVISIIIALTIFSSEFLSNRTSFYLTRILFTNQKIIFGGVIYLFCLFFELILLGNISDKPTFSYSLNIFSINLYITKNSDILQNNLIFHYNFESIIILYAFIYFLVIISIYIILVMMSNLISYYTKETIAKRLTDEIKKSCKNKKRIHIDNEFQILYETLNISLNNYDFELIINIIRSLFDEIFDYDYKLYKDDFKSFIQRMEVTLLIAHKNLLDTFVIDILDKINKYESKIIDKSQRLDFCKFFFSFILVYLNERNFLITNEIVDKFNKTITRYISDFDDEEKKKYDEYKKEFLLCINDGENKKVDRIISKLN